jgi:hypothetical protein
VTQQRVDNTKMRGHWLFPQVAVATYLIMHVFR